MNKGIQRSLLRHLGGQEHETAVIGSWMVAPNMRRLRFSAPTAFEDIRLTPGTYVRGWFPDPDHPGREVQRGYTLVDIDVEAHEYSIDFLLHDPAGPASIWARTAQRGDLLTVTPFGVRPFEVPDPAPLGYLLIADAAGIPCLNDLMAAIPSAVLIEVVLGIHHDDDLLIPLHEREDVRVTRVRADTPGALAQAIPERPWEDWRAVVICEAGQRRACLNRLGAELGFPRSELSGQAYWKQGKGMGVSRQRSEDESAEILSETPAEISAELDRRESAAVVSRAPSRWALARGAELLRPLRPALVGAGVLQAIITVAEVVPLLLLAEIGHLLLSGADPAQVNTLLLAAAVVIGAAACLSSLVIVTLHVVDARFLQALRMRLVDHLAVLPLGWFTSSTRARVKRVIQDDTLALHYLTTHAVPDAVAAFIGPLAVLIYLFVVDWRIALALLAPILLALWLMYTMVFRSFDSVVEAPQRAEKMEAEAAALLDAQAVAAVYPGAARFYQRSLREYIDFLHHWQMPFTGLKSLMGLATSPLTLMLVILVAALPWIVTGGAEVSVLLPFLLLGTTFASALLAAGYQLQAFKAGIDAAGRIGAVLRTEPLAEVEQSSGVPVDSGITVRNVSFSHRKGVPVLQGVSLDIPAGRNSAIVGHSGVGKSTLAHLLARFADPDDGSIELGGIPLSSFTNDDLYQRLGFVFQDLEMLVGTVRENIALGRPEASCEEIEAAARTVGIHERVAALPDGYDTLLAGQEGLSGGELQLIALARVVLADPEVLILDEATAHADPPLHARVQRALEEVMRDRTVVLIAHRLATVTSCDQIIVLDEGQVAQHGTHEELLATPGRYRDLWEVRA